MQGFQRGHPRFGGRKPGQKNRATIERQKAEARSLINAIEKLGVPPATLDDLTPVSIMQFVMVERFRVGDHAGALAAANAVAPYVHPKLAMTDMRITGTYIDKSTADLIAEREELARKMLDAEPIEGTAVELDARFPEPVEPVEAAQLKQEPTAALKSEQPLERPAEACNAGHALDLDQAQPDPAQVNSSDD